MQLSVFLILLFRKVFRVVWKTQFCTQVVYLLISPTCFWCYFRYKNYRCSSRAWLASWANPDNSSLSLWDNCASASCWSYRTCICASKLYASLFLAKALTRFCFAALCLLVDGAKHVEPFRADQSEASRARCVTNWKTSWVPRTAGTPWFCPGLTRYRMETWNVPAWGRPSACENVTNAEMSENLCLHRHVLNHWEQTFQAHCWAHNLCWTME